MKISHTEDVSRLRKMEYPPVEDFADALYWQSRGDPSKMANYLSKVDAVKKRFHKAETLDSAKARKNAEINAAREFANTDTFTYEGKAIRCRPLDRSDIDGTNGYVALFGTFPEGWMGGWKCADNTYVPIATVDDWKAFYKAMVDCGNANFRYAQQLKARLAVADTQEEIAAIKWEAPNAE